MRTFALMFAFIGILATLYAFIGSLFAARNQLPIDSLPMKIYKYSFRCGVIVALIGIFISLIV